MKLNIDHRGYDNMILHRSVRTYTKSFVSLSSSIQTDSGIKLCSVVSQRPSSSYTGISNMKRTPSLSKETAKLWSLTLKDSVDERRHVKISWANNFMKMRIFGPKHRNFPTVSGNMGPVILPPGWAGWASAGLIFGLLVCYSTLEPVHAEESRGKNDEQCDMSPVKFAHGKQIYTDFYVTGIPGDGRCLFRSVAHGACLRNGESAPSESQQKELADELRARVADEFIKRREESEWFVEGDFDSYVSEMRKPNVWGGEPELLMASHVLQMPITVYMHDDEAGGLISIAEYGQEYGKHRSIRVLYHGYGHYDSLQITDSHSKL